MVSSVVEGLKRGAHGVGALQALDGQQTNVLVTFMRVHDDRLCDDACRVSVRWGWGAQSSPLHQSVGADIVDEAFFPGRAFLFTVWVAKVFLITAALILSKVRATHLPTSSQKA